MEFESANTDISELLFDRLGVKLEQVVQLCRALGVKHLALFGSVLTNRFGPKSDVDVLVEFQTGAIKTLFDRGLVQIELEEFLGRHVDLTELRLVDNQISRRGILANSRKIF